MTPNESPIERCRRELRDLMATGLDYDRFPTSPPPTQNLQLWKDCLRAAEHLHESYLTAVVPEGDEAYRVWVEVVDDILECVELGRWDQLRPSDRAARTLCGWWDRMTWFDRTLHLLRGGRVPVAGDRVLRNRPLNPWADWGIGLFELWLLAPRLSSDAPGIPPLIL